MQSHSAPGHPGAHGHFSGVTRLLDIGGGSGCFAIALAQQYSELTCTIMDLPAMCQVADRYIRNAGAGDRVDTRAVNMFRDEWPTGYDAMFFSNVFHDWSLETCTRLAASAHAALPAGGRIYLHEMLIADGGVGPPTPAAFAMLMLTATRGSQFTFGELKTLLQDAGFVDAAVTSTYGYYSLIRALKR
jgi:acetylserotonin N-methyltransferase